MIGSGPIVIGQACEFDYSGGRRCACCATRASHGPDQLEPGDDHDRPGWADRTYLEPLDVEGVAAVLRRERPDALLPTLGGQTALNLASELHGGHPRRARRGADRRLLRRHPPAEDRELFARPGPVGLRVPASAIITVGEAAARSRPATCGCPSSIRPAFTLGGQGGGFASTPDEPQRDVERGLRESPIGQVLLEESVAGWGEFELEVIRDRIDNVIIVCSIETSTRWASTPATRHVAPAMTLSDREYQALRDAAATVIRAVGVETGGSTSSSP